eukprot:2746519-Amphidinium_carterae.1
MSVVNQAQITKTSGCICNKVKKHKDDPKGLRVCVQAEIKELRSYDLKEHESLHALLLHKVQQALSGKLPS